MSRRIYTSLALIALIAILALPTLALAQTAPSTYTRPLTVLFWKGSMIEMYINFTELRDHYGIGSATYWYFALYRGPNYVTDLNVLIAYTTQSGAVRYCQVRYITDELPGGSMIRYLLMEVNPNVTVMEGGYTVSFYINKTDYKYHVNIGGTKYATDIYGYVRFHYADLKEAMSEAYGSWDKVPAECKEIVSECEGSTYCWVRVLGLIIPSDIDLPAAPYYIWVRPVERNWEFQARPPMTAVNPADYVTVNKLLGSTDLAFGRYIIEGRTANGLAVKGVKQTVEFVEGKKTIVGQLNVTIAWSDLKSILVQHLTSDNVTFAVRLMLPQTFTVVTEVGGTFNIWTGRAAGNYTFNGLSPAATTALLFVNTGAATKSAKLISTVYGTANFGVFNRTATGAVIINATVDPLEPLRIANKAYTLRFKTTGGEEVTYYVPAIETSVAVAIIENNATLKYFDASTGTVYTVLWKNVGVSGSPLDNYGFVFKRTVMFLFTGVDATIFPASIYYQFHPEVFGDTDKVNVYDVVVVNVTNAPINASKITISDVTYTVSTKGTTYGFNITEAPLVLGCRGIIVGYAQPNVTSEVFMADVYAEAGRALYTLNLTILPAPYGGALYYPVPTFYLNLTPPPSQAIYLVVLPPVNYTNIGPMSNNRLSDEEAGICDGTLTFRVRPFLMVRPVDNPTTVGNNLVLKMTTTPTVRTGGFLLLFGLGYNLSDPGLTIWIGNASIPFADYGIFVFEVLKYYKVKVADIAASEGRFALVVPLFKMIMEGYNPFGTGADVFAGQIFVRVNSTVQTSNDDWGSIAYSGITSNTIARITIDYYQPVILVDPGIYVNATGYVVTLTYSGSGKSFTVYLGNATVVSEAVYKTPYAAMVELKKHMMQMSSYALRLAENATMATILVIGYGSESPITTEYIVQLYNSGQGIVGDVAVIPVRNVKMGFYYNETAYIPTLPFISSGYVLRVYNATAGSRVGSSTTVTIVPSIVVVDKAYNKAAMSIAHWDEDYTFTPMLDVLPRTTLEIYGFGFMPAEGVTIIVNSVPQMTVPGDEVSEEGTWKAELNITAARAGEILNLNVTQSAISNSKLKDVAMTLRVTEIIWNGLRVTVTTGSIAYESGTAYLPVLVTATYSDMPLACSNLVHVKVMALYDFEQVGGVWQYKKIETEAACLGDGQWFAMLKLPADTPRVFLIKAEVAYEIVPGVQRLTQFATAAVVVEPQLKEMVAAAASKAEEAATNVMKVEETLKTVSSKVDDVRKMLEGVAGKVDMLLSKVSDVAAAVADVKSSLDAIAGKIDSYYGEVTTKLDKIAAGVEAVKTGVEDISGKLDDVASKLDDVKVTVEKTMKSVEDLRSKIAGLAAEVASEVGKVVDAAKTAIIDEIGRRIDECCSTLKSAVSELSGKLDKVSSTLGSIEKSISNLSGKVSDVSSKLDKLSTSVSGLASKIDEVKGSLATKIDDVKKSVDSLAGKVDAVSSSMNDVKSKVDGISANVMIFGAAGILVGVVVLALLVYAGIRGGLFATH